MKVVALALVLLSLVGGCASQQSSSGGASQSPSAGASQYTSQETCERAGRTWNGTSSVCM